MLKIEVSLLNKISIKLHGWDMHRSCIQKNIKNAIKISYLNAISFLARDKEINTKRACIDILYAHVKAKILSRYLQNIVKFKQTIIDSIVLVYKNKESCVA